MNAEIDKDEEDKALNYIAAHSIADELMKSNNSLKMAYQESKKSAVTESISASERILQLEAELADKNAVDS